MKHLSTVFKKEFNAYFTSPAAWLFMGAFLVGTLFAFFWVESFFARNIADMKPFFKWIPVLLIFLVGALSMRTWSEELRSGTIETLLTSPMSMLQIVLGKFLANLALVALALTLTLPLAFSIAWIGPLDWGPVIGGYIASLFLAAAYIAIGLYMSGRTDNPIVALILTVACAGVFYLIGSPILTTLFGHQIGSILQLIGSGSRFESITRGVLDIRDIYFYLSIVGVFGALNLLSLERLRWAGNPSQKHHRRWLLVTFLTIINLLVANFWMHFVRFARADLTEGKIYSLSDATKEYVLQAEEPLLIRGYFSRKSHPLLEPLVPQLKDILEEYQVIGGSKLRVEFVDPHSNQDIEVEAADKYGIRPVPFRITGRYESGVVNSYFDLVIAYGDQYEVLSFDDLIEIKYSGKGEPEVLLHNAEYAITSAVRKVISGFRSGGSVYDDLPTKVTFKAYVSPTEKLPQPLADFQTALETTLKSTVKQSSGKFDYIFADPDAGDGTLAEQLYQQYGFVPQVAGLFDTQPFWFYMVLENEHESIQIGLSEELSESTLKKNIEVALKRMTPGYMKTVALITPAAPAQPQNPYMPQTIDKSFNRLRAVLEESVNVISPDLSSGMVPADADMLIVLSPQDLSDKAVFAIDQFLMQGGTVAIATAPFDISISNQLIATPHQSGLEDWLTNIGFTLKNQMVLDTQNTSLPVPVPRRVGPISVNEIAMIPYPYFPDVRGENLNEKHPATSSLNQLTFNWISPIEIEASKQVEREITLLASSSPNSWTSNETNIMPDYERYPTFGFASGLEKASYKLAVVSEGQFDSYYKDKESPLLSEATKETTENDSESPSETAEEPVYSSVIQSSSDSARLILISSNSFAEDTVLSIAAQGIGIEYTAPLELMQNLVDWSLDDSGLLNIRSRTQLARTLNPMTDATRRSFEYGNYAAALVGLLLVWIIRKGLKQRKYAHYSQMLKGIN